MPWHYPWSSAAAHIGEGDIFGLLDFTSWSHKMDAVNWQAALVARQDPELVRQLRIRAQTRHPLAGDRFSE